jgi:hypothetical protein
VQLEEALACAEEFPKDPEQWALYTDQGNTQKLALFEETQMGPISRQLVSQFNGVAMIRFLERLTGIDGLVPDPHLAGGGLHQLEPGGFLKVHADFNRHEKLNLDRRVNVLLYLNEEWRDEWGGYLELWTRDMSRRAHRIAPLAGRVVIFNTTSNSFHGNPEPVASPPDISRRSLAFYYYTNGRPEEERAPVHSTLYQTPGKAPVGPGDTANRWSQTLRRVARELTPPILVKVVRRMRGRAS